jgi:hypothetical protein
MCAALCLLQGEASDQQHRVCAAGAAADSIRTTHSAQRQKVGGDDVAVHLEHVFVLFRYPMNADVLLYTRLLLICDQFIFTS